MSRRSRDAAAPPDDPREGDRPEEQETETRRHALARGWKLLPRLLPYLRPYRLMAVTSTLLTAVLAAVALAEPWPLAFVVDSVLGEKGVPGWISGTVGGSTGSLLAFAVIASLVLTLLSGGLTVVNEYLTTTVDQRMVLDFRSDLFQTAQRLSLSYHDNTRTGILMYRINNQATAAGQIVVALPMLAQSLLTILGMAFVAYQIDHVLALLALAVAPLIYYSITFYANRIEPQLYRVRGLEAMNLAIVHEAMAMLRVVIAFGREKHEFARFRTQGEKTVDARVRLTVRQTLFRLVVSLITAIGTASVLYVGARRVMSGNISIGELLVVMSYIAAVYAPLEKLTNVMTTFQQHFIALEHALDLMDTPQEVAERPDATALDRVRGDVQFENVSFGYKTRPDTLSDISFRVAPGRSIAIVGQTGAGKSTVASLIPRFYDPDQGRVLIDGVDVRDVTLESLRDQFSIVLQEPLLFKGTIADNIAYGKIGAEREEIVAAAKAANAHDFIQRLPQKYETELGERGSKISGGERQRLAVARAFLRDAPILILDEPTSSVDSRTEGVILDALERLMAGRTTIMIAHRLSTIRGADRILVMQDGKILERGSHEELLARDGLFRQMWDTQTGARRAGSARRGTGPRSGAALRDDKEAPAPAHANGPVAKFIRWRPVAMIRWAPPVASSWKTPPDPEARRQLAEIRGIDHILVVDDGRVVQHGTHDELIRRPGSYLTMWTAAVWGDDADPDRPLPENGDHGEPGPPLRLAEIAGADRVVVVRDGQAVEQGTHDELFARGGLYRQLLTTHADENGDVEAGSAPEGEHR